MQTTPVRSLPVASETVDPDSIATAAPSQGLAATSIRIAIPLGAVAAVVAGPERGFTVLDAFFGAQGPAVPLLAVGALLIAPVLMVALSQIRHRRSRTEVGRAGRTALGLHLLAWPILGFVAFALDEGRDDAARWGLVAVTLCSGSAHLASACGLLGAGWRASEPNRLSASHAETAWAAKFGFAAGVSLVALAVAVGPAADPSWVGVPFRLALGFLVLAAFSAAIGLLDAGAERAGSRVPASSGVHDIAAMLWVGGLLLDASAWRLDPRVTVASRALMLLAVAPAAELYRLRCELLAEASEGQRRGRSGTVFLLVGGAILAAVGLPLLLPAHASLLRDGRYELGFVQCALVVAAVTGGLGFRLSTLPEAQGRERTRRS